MKAVYKTIYDVKHKVYRTFENGDFFSDVKYFEKKNKDKLNIRSSIYAYNEKIKSGSFDYSAIYRFQRNFVNDFSIYYKKCSAIIHRDDIALIQAHLEKHEDTQLNAIVNFLTENTNIQSVYYNFYYQTVENYEFLSSGRYVDSYLRIEADYASNFFDINNNSFKKLFSQQTLFNKKYYRDQATECNLSLQNSMLKSALGVEDFYYGQLIVFCLINFCLLKKLLNRNYLDFWNSTIQNCCNNDNKFFECYKWHFYGNKSCIINETIDAPEIYFGCRFLHEYENTDKNYEKTYWIENELKNYVYRLQKNDKLDAKTMTNDELYDHFKKSYTVDNPYRNQKG
jgi:hypothetical protein